MKKTFRANLYFLIILLIEIFAPYLLSPLFSGLGVPIIGILVLNHFCLFIIPAIFYFIITRESVKDTLRLNPVSIKEILFAILIGLLSQPITMFLSVITSFFFPNNVAMVIGKMGSIPYIVMLLVIAVMPAITEEITIRGIVLKGYDDKNIIKASIITGLMFGMFHLTACQFLYATALGALFAYMVRITNSIFVSAIAHFIVNGTQVSLQKLMPMLGVNTTSDEVAKQANKLLSMSWGVKFGIAVFYGIIALIFSLLILMVLRKMKRIAQQRGVVNIEEGNKFYGKREVKDPILDIPFIIAIVAYLMYMVATVFR